MPVTLSRCSRQPVWQVLPLLDQLTPMYLDVASGRQEFSPSPPELQRLVRAHYGAAPAQEAS